MKRPLGPILQTDARGRIQLPKDLRNSQFFELAQDSSGTILLTPLTWTRSAFTSRHNPKTIWLNAQVSQWIQTRLKSFAEGAPPKLNGTKIRAIVLFGSRARGDSQTSSDFDVAIFVSDPANFRLRSQWSETLDEHFLGLKSELENHGVTGDLSWNFLPMTPDSPTLPSLYFSVAEDGIVLFQENKEFDRWKLKVSEWMQAHRVRSVGKGKFRKWEWNAKDG